ncbi:helicase-related protein [Vibrio maritimus]|uniref:helicase-related protein n=1 Tax=Vibrio maritimus TaxID=990268 RepID=UPI0040676054
MRLPTDYLSLNVDSTLDCQDGSTVVVRGVITRWQRHYRRGYGEISTNEGRFELSSFDPASSEINQALQFAASDRHTIELLVKVKDVGQQRYLTTPKLIPDSLRLKRVGLYKTCRVKALNGLSYSAKLSEYFEELIAASASYIRERISSMQLPPAKLREVIEAHGIQLEDVLREVHYPSDTARAQTCFSILQKLASLLMVASKACDSRIDAPLTFKKEVNAYFDRASFCPTDEQQGAVRGILSAYQLGAPRSVLMGDVGTGKTIVGAMVARHFVDAGGRVAIMIPSVILGIQIYTELVELFPELSVCFLLNRAELARFKGRGFNVAAEVSESMDIVVGTSAIIHNRASVEFDLVWVDEEQRLGVSQKEAELVTVGRTHLLLSSATCIPRTQAMLELGMVPYFAITRYHTPRQVLTELFSHNQVVDVVHRVQDTVAKGFKVLFICTKRESLQEGSQQDRVDAQSLYQDWVEVYGEDSVKLAHGGLSKEVNDQAMTDMKTGSGRILVSTTFVEVGVTIPNLMHVVVINPENLGLMQLHQIRGRVARSGGVGYCDLIPTKPISDDSLIRLKTLCENEDGFSLAKADLLLRGMGDMGDGTAQSGQGKGLLVDHAIEFESLNAVIEKVESSSLMLGTSGEKKQS